MKDRIYGALLGAYIGAKLGFAGYTDPNMTAHSPEEMEKIELKPMLDYKMDRTNSWIPDLTNIISIGVKSYIEKDGRTTPEDFAKVFQNDENLANDPTFLFDVLHTTQEVLKEGMHPRISGMGNAPAGIISPAMVATGIYHAGNPEYAYLDGVEIASVNQGKLGADWSAYCATAVAAALGKDATNKDVFDTVKEIILRTNKDVMYHIFERRTYLLLDDPKAFEKWWYYNVNYDIVDRQNLYNATNPMRLVMPIICMFEKDVVKAMQYLVTPPEQHICIASACIAGAIYGALYGAEIFPEEWRKWAEPEIKDWLPIIKVVEKRKTKEKIIISDTEALLVSKKDNSKDCKIEDTKLYDKICGCLLAGAIGNAMGSPVEGWLYPKIDEKYPDHVMGVLDPRRLESEDDNQMAMFIVETYLEKKGVPIMARDFGETWKKRMNREMFFVNCMGHCYDLITSGWDARITGHWTQVTGSTVMCMEPVGIYHACDTEYAEIDARAISYMYQRGLDVDVAVSLAATVAEAFKDNTSIDKICQAALNAAPKTKLHTFDKRPYDSAYEYMSICLDVADKYDDVFSLREGLYEHLNYHCICPLELWAFAVAMFKCAKGDVRMSAIGGTNIGRDSDTIAGRAAMLAGILNGRNGVPTEWVDLMNKKSIDKIEENAKLMVKVIENKLDTYRAISF